MDKFPRELLESIRNRHNLVGWVSAKVALRQIGDDYVGSCPFHEDTTPSFRVNQRRYICFGCRSKGDIISWVRYVKGLDFPDAVRMLSRGTKPLPSLPQKPQILSTTYEARAVNRIIDINSRLNVAFLYEAARCQTALDYITSRGQLGNFGYCPKDGLEFTSSCIQSGLQPEDLLLTGAFAQTTNGAIYCRLFGRMIIPLRNRTGHILGFSGREIPGSSCRGPKYLDPKTTPAFSKGRYVFGLDRVRPGKVLFMVEGQIDCLTMQRRGVNCCATNTSHLSREQLNVLCDTTGMVMVAYDGDIPGMEGALRAHKALVDAGLHARVFILPDGKDPDEWVGSGCEGGYRFNPSLPQLAGDFMADKYKMDRLQELAKPWVEANIKEGYCHYNILDYCMQAYPHHSKEIKDAVIKMRDNCIEVDGWRMPQDEDIHRLIRAWKKPCREVRLSNGKTK